MSVAFIVKETGVTLFKDGGQYSAPSDFWSFSRILEKIKNKDFDGIEVLFTTDGAIEEVTAEVESKLSTDLDNVKIINGEVFVDGRKIYNSVTDRIIKMVTSGFDVTPLTNFLRRLLKNPSKTAVTELYSFMEKSDQAVDADGFIIAYKKVRNDYFDIHSGTVNYNIGNIVEMPRNEVDDDRANLCSEGLHFCSFSYLNSFGGSVTPGGSRLLIVKIDPADVVSIPADYNDAKARTCKMEVIGEILEEKNVLAKAPVYKNSQSAEAQVSPDVSKNGILTIQSSVAINDHSSFEHFVSCKVNRIMTIKNIQNASDLENCTLSQLTDIYNNIVSVYNVIQSNERVASITKFKCSKTDAIKKISDCSSKLVEIATKLGE